MSDPVPPPAPGMRPGPDVSSRSAAPPAVLDPAARVSHTDGPEGPVLLVRQGDRVHRLGGTAAVAAVRALLALADDGSVPLGPLDNLGDQQAQAVRALLTRLVDAGLLTAPEVAQEVLDATPAERGLWLRSGRAVEPSTVRQRLTDTRVTVLGSTELAARLAVELRGAGATTQTGHRGEDVVATGPDGFVVAVGADPDDPLLVEWNARALATGTAWLQVLPHDGRRAVVGPLFVPGTSACHECFRLRRAANFPDLRLVPDLVRSTPVATQVPPAVQPGLELVLVGLAVDRVLERVALRDRAGSTAPGAIVLLEVGGDGVRLDEHRVLRVPRCPACWAGADRGLPQVWFHGDAPDEVHAHGPAVPDQPGKLTDPATPAVAPA